MMRQVNIYKAKTHLSQLLAQVQKGEEIIIAKAGVAVARLLSLSNRLRRMAPAGGRCSPLT